MSATHADAADPVQQGRRILVTGGAGFLGSRLVGMLVARQAEVVVWTRRQDGNSGSRFEIPEAVDVVEVDVADATSVDAQRPASFDAIYHLAGRGEYAASFRDPRRDFSLNAGAALNVLEYARQHSPMSRVVIASTAHVYGEASGGERGALARQEPISPYGASKRCAEIYARLYARAYGLHTAIARLFSIFGPGQHRYMVYDFLCKLRADPSRLQIMGDGCQTRDLSYVDDVARALLSIEARARCQGEEYEVASGTQVSVKDLAHTLAELMRLSPRLEYSQEANAGAVSHFIADLSALENLGHRSRVPLQDGLAKTVAWFQSLPTNGDAISAPQGISRCPNEH